MHFARERASAAGLHLREASVLSCSTPQRSRRAGFTMLELIIVFVILGIMLSFMVQAVRGSWVASSRRSASRDVTSYLFRGRSIAIQQSRAAWVVRSGSVLKIMVDSSGTPVQLGSQIDFFQRYGATLGGKDTIQFDPRGRGLGLPTAPKFIVALGRSEERRVGKECRSRWSPYH